MGQSTPVPRIAFFNHKGGVGKTVLTANLAAALADAGFRVLIVDADPQCNITSYLLADDIVDDLLDSSDGENGRTIWSALKKFIDGKGAVREVKPSPVRPRVILLPGDIQLFRFEDDLNEFWGECFRRKMRGINGMSAISDVVGLTVSSHKIDIVLYDCGPNIGPLNRATILDCDGIIVPVACDLFSLRALKTLGRALVEWITDWQTVVDLAPSGSELLIGRPALMGYVPQRFRTYGGSPEKRATAFISRLERSIISDVARPLQQLSPEMVQTGRSLKLGELRDLGNLVSESLAQRKPLWQVSGGNPEKREYAKHAFSLLAAQVVRRSGLKRVNV